MLAALRPFLRHIPRPGATRKAPAVPPGERVYAIGDIHGRLDLFRALSEEIERDDAARGAADTTVILLGDLIDRGPDSAGVLAHARAWRERRPVRILCGNHEELFLGSFGNPEILRHFLRAGGRETLLSYAITATELATLTFEETAGRLSAIVPAGDVDFVASFEDIVVRGDYAFVHAGLRPERPLDAQEPADLRWIREPFLSARAPFSHVAVHGHTISPEPRFLPHRIGIDTGAYASGRLTALGLEGADRWIVEACETDGTIGCATRSVT